jgi:hypothetical protein
VKQFSYFLVSVILIYSFWIRHFYVSCFLCDWFEFLKLWQSVQLPEDFERIGSSETTHSALMPTRMTELRWIIIIMSIILTVQFVSVECANNTTREGKLKIHRSPLSTRQGILTRGVEYGFKWWKCEVSIWNDKITTYFQNVDTYNLWNLLIYGILSHLIILICQILITEIFSGVEEKG